MRAVVERSVRAFEAAGVPALVRLLTDDAGLEMPPVPLWYRGSRDDGRCRSLAARAAAHRPDVADDVELAEKTAMAMTLVPETWSPTERAVFVLREAFDVSLDEIAPPSAGPAAVR